MMAASGERPGVASWDSTVQAPYAYLDQNPGKNVRGLLINSLNEWYQAPAERVAVIKRVIGTLHTASLVIDDIQDGSTTRRGVPAAHIEFGVARSINAANHAYFVALQLVLSLGDERSVHVFTKWMLELHKGQGIELYWRDCHVCPTEAEYLEMCGLKTGGLFALAAELLGCFSPPEVEAARKTEIGELVKALGMFFQTRDDYVNLADAHFMTTKGFCDDIEEGCYSFPVVHHIRHAHAHDLPSSVEDILRMRTNDVALKKECLEALAATRSLEYTVGVLSCQEQRITAQIKALGGNRDLSGLVNKLAGAYQKAGA